MYICGGTFTLTAVGSAQGGGGYAPDPVARFGEALLPPMKTARSAWGANQLSLDRK